MVYKHCRVSILIFPIIFISKSKAWKDYMFYMGTISGFLALLYPTEALNKSLGNTDLWRFYICHMIIFIVPLLSVLLKVHTLDYRRIWRRPFCVCGVLFFIMINQVLQSELGIIALRGNDISEVTYTNTSFIWGPTDGVAVIFSWLTLNFMKTIPFWRVQRNGQVLAILLDGSCYFLLFPNTAFLKVLTN